MANKPRTKLPIHERAKQFMPFAAVGGVHEAYLGKEKILVEKHELSDELADELDTALRSLKKGDMATITHYCNGEYIKTTGIVARIDNTCRILQIVYTKIPFDDIYDIKIAED